MLAISLLFVFPFSSCILAVRFRTCFYSTEYTPYFYNGYCFTSILYELVVSGRATDSADPGVDLRESCKLFLYELCESTLVA
jgi:hypothetical protein